MTSSDGVPPHSVMPKALYLGKRGGYLMSGGRSGLYLWHCATLSCVDEGQWTTINLARHHDETLGRIDPVARMGGACSNESLWDVRECPSKGYLGLTHLLDAAAVGSLTSPTPFSLAVDDSKASTAGFLVCYDHYLRLKAYPEAMAVYCLRGRVNTSVSPPPPAPPPSPVHHLQYMSAYDFPSAECGSAAGWHNLFQAKSTQDVEACATAAAAATAGADTSDSDSDSTGRQLQVRSMLLVEGTFFTKGSPGLADKGCARIPGGCLRNDWQAQWAAIAVAVGPLVANGTLLGFNLGDELLCHSLSMENLTAAADAVRKRRFAPSCCRKPNIYPDRLGINIGKVEQKTVLQVRASFPTAVIWWNECGHTAAADEKWGSGVPASVGWVSIDFPYTTTSKPGAKVPTWNSSGATAVMGLAPASMVLARTI